MASGIGHLLTFRVPCSGLPARHLSDRRLAVVDSLFSDAHGLACLAWCELHSIALFKLDLLVRQPSSIPGCNLGHGGARSALPLFAASSSIAFAGSLRAGRKCRTCAGRRCGRRRKGRRATGLVREFVVGFGQRRQEKGPSRWQLMSKGTPRHEDDPDGSLMRTVWQSWLKLEKKLLYFPHMDQMRLLSALCVAALAHKDQKRKSGEPYLVHPIAVAELLADLKLQADVVIAGLLHDTVEDNNDITFADLEELFGRDVRSIVQGETKASKRTSFMRSDEGWKRLYDPLHKFIFGSAPRDLASHGPDDDAAMAKARQQAVNLRDLFLAMADDYRVIVVKLADRLHNMRTLEFMPPHKRQAISTETLVVFTPLAHRLGIWTFKSELEDLSFKYLYPDDFAKLDRLLMQRRYLYSLTLASAARELEDMFEQDSRLEEQKVRVKITGREKGMYSLWRKLQRCPKYHNNIDRVNDIIALRVVLDIDRRQEESEEEFDDRGIELCYYALSLAYSLDGWDPPTNILCTKDYIKHPKPNGYRSLHTILVHRKTHTRVELQIRTREMHNVAEYGMPAHWAYKEEQFGEHEDRAMQSRRVEWLQSINDKNRWHEADPIQFVLDVLREELGTRCFVFLRNGRILNLSRGCTVLDAAFKIGREVGFHMLHAEINDERVEPSATLCNGDCVNIITSPDVLPKWSWLDAAFLRSTQAELIAYFRRRQTDKENQQMMRNFAGAAAAFATGMAGVTSVMQAFYDSKAL